MDSLGEVRTFTLAPPGVALRACRVDAVAGPSINVALPPSLHDASGNRRAEFLAGRHCAARALAAHGAASGHVGIGTHGAPAFPAGLVGSIAHTARWAVAAVADASRYSALGVDCEGAIAPAMRDEIAALVADACERRLAEAVLPDADLALALLFSSKESAYKALSANLCGTIPEFLDARAIAVDADRVELAVRGALREALGAPTLVVRWDRLDERTVLTLVALPARAAIEHVA
jgi:enterobactin synthetase component D